MKPLAALLLAPALALPTSFGMNERTETRREPLAAGSHLSVKSANGRLTVTGWDKEEVELQADIKEREKDSVTLSVRKTGSGLEIEAQLPRRVGSWWGESDGVNMTLKVPRRLMGHFGTSNGRIEVTGLEGAQVLATSNGRINAEDIKGDLDANTSNASVTVKRVSGSLRGATSNGGLQVEQVSGGIEFSTSNGSIQAEGLDGQGKGISLTTSNGGIRVGLGNAKGEVDASTSNGGVSVERQGMELIETHKSSARVKVPGSSQVIRLRTSNGGITIR
jgi:DUF4097 and DUF4098 domain-containing protein YvlB